MINIKFIGLVVKRIVFAFLVLYGINVILSSVNFNIPINIMTVGIGSILGSPGIMVLIILKLII